MKDWLWLIPTLPLAGFLINACLRPSKGVAAAIGCASPLASFGLSVAAFFQSHERPLHETFFNWIHVGSLSIPFGLTVDHLAAVMILVVTGVGSLIHLYSIGYMHDDPGFSRFFAYLNLFMFSMLLLVMADSILLMFVGWEGVGLCSYLLIGFWYKDLKNADAGKKAFITNRIGDFGFLLGIFLLWKLFGTLDFEKMGAMKVVAGGTATAAGLCLFLGACGKSAQIPLHVWLPDAMAGPTPVSALIHAATMVTAGVYMTARMGFLYTALPDVMEVVAGIGAATALMAALIAVTQNDIKKILAYSTISQLGFMFVGISTAEFTTGIFHVVTHAFFKALLFLGAGAIIHALNGEQDIRKMGGLRKVLPSIFWTFLIGALALAGFPGSSGFFSKDLILLAVMNKHWTGIQAVMLLTALLTAFYTTRMVVYVFFGPGEHPHVHKPGATMIMPLVILALLSAIGGLLEHGIQEFLGEVKAPEHLAATAQITSGIVFLIGAAAGLVCFLFNREAVKRFIEGAGKKLHWLVSNKFFIDEIYEYLVIAPVQMGSTALWFVVDRLIIDGLLVGGAGRLAYAVGGVFRRAHTGSLNAGTATFLFGVLAALAYLFYRLAIWTSHS